MTTRFLTLTLLVMLMSASWSSAQNGYFDAPFKRYEADLAILGNGAVSLTKSYSQVDLQSEASDQTCVDLGSAGSSAEFNLTEPADGFVLRYSVPDGESADIGLYDGDQKIASLTLTSKWSWESLWNNGDPNNVGVTNKNPRMRFDEIRYKLPNQVSTLKLIQEQGNLVIDFIEMEPVPAAILAPEDAAIFNGDGSNLQAFIDLNGGKTIFIPSGIYHINSQLYFGVAKTKLQGAGMWYTQLNFTVTDESNGGLRANAAQISYADLFLTSDMTTRTKGYSGFHGVYTPGSIIRNVWVEHCATGAWIGQYVQGGPEYADGFIISNCRFRNTYADGVNLCKGTRNAIVEHCSFRNNGDDAMAIWCADGLECINNTFRYNTVENGWRAAGAGLYGGKDNKFYNLIIKDNLDAGITITNTFPGIGFNATGLHDFHNISLIGCGTFNATYNDRVGAINIYHASGAGLKVQNIRFYNINLIDSKCDAIRIAKTAGSGLFNVSFENVNIDGTGKEYPNNNVLNTVASRGFAVIIERYPLGGATYCGLTYSNLGGNSNATAFNTTQKGSFSWTALTGCDVTAVSGIALAPADTSLAGGITLRLIPNFTPANATNKIVTYTTSNPDVATVDYDGLVTTLSMGEATITVTSQDGNFSANAIIRVTSDPVVCYKIKSRWQNTYLYDAGDRVKYSVAAANDTYLWQIDDVDGVKEIRNLFTGDYMHLEDLLGFVQCTPRSPGSLSSRWSLEDASDGFVRIKSEWNTLNFIHIENLQSQAQYGPVETSWWSAMWLLEPVIIPTRVSAPIIPKMVTPFPNPSRGNFSLVINNFAPNETVSITIFNLTGQPVYTTTCRVDATGYKNVTVAAGPHISPGNYLIVAKGLTEISTSKLLIY